MPVQTQTEFLELVRKSGLISDAVLERFLAAGEPTSAADAANLLQARGLLTPFQAKVLLAGRHTGMILGQYKILDQIGRGGMGIVFLAEHQKLNRKVAIKVLPRDKVTDKLAVDRFYREARALAALDHPNIVKAYDVSNDNGIHHVVMEYIQGVNLQDQLDEQGPLPWREAAGYVAQACRGLQHAHERGLVHRDVKPSNLLVDQQGTLKILALGLARCFADEADNLTGRLADKREITGSADYIAPEIALGSEKLDIRADIYSLGVTLYALVTGKPPFTGSAMQ